MSYYSYKLDDVLSMNNTDYYKLLSLMNINEARNTLKGFELSIYPKLKEQNRKDVHRKYSKIAFPDNFVKKNIVKLSDLKRVLGNG